MFGLYIEHRLVQSLVDNKSLIIYITVLSVNLYILHSTGVMDCPKAQWFHVLPVMVQSKELCLIKSKRKISKPK